MSVIKYPYITEKTTVIIDEMNVLTFIVDVRAKKPQIKREIEKLFDVTVTSVKTMITNNGNKKALITLSEEDSAGELISRLGVF